MDGDKEDSERLPTPLDPFQPKGPWPTPTPGVPYPQKKEEQSRLLKQVLEKLDEIEKRLEKIERLLTEKFDISP